MSAARASIASSPHDRPSPSASTASSVNRRGEDAEVLEQLALASGSRLTLQSIVARIVRCRSGRSRTAAVSSGRLCSRRSAMPAGVRMRTFAAASSIASGSPSSRRQMSARSAALSAVTSKPASTARARSTNSVHGGGARGAVEARRAVAGRGRQRRDLVHLLAADAQHDAARHEERRRRRDRVQPHQDGGGIDDLLEVVEHEQHAAIGERVRDALLERGFAVVADAEAVRDRRQQQPRLEHALERHEVRCRRGTGRRSPARSRSRAGSCRCRRGRCRLTTRSLPRASSVAHARRCRPRGRSSAV